jgi:uncharacterized membrane protein
VHFERSIEIQASQQRVWDVVSDISSWPKVTETVDSIEVLTAGPIGVGSRVRIRQPKLPEATYEVTAWDPPSFFAWQQKSGGVTIDAGHRVEELGEGRARLTLTIDMRGLLVPIMGRLYRDLTNRYLQLETEGMRRAAEAG